MKKLIAVLLLLSTMAFAAPLPDAPTPQLPSYWQPHKLYHVAAGTGISVLVGYSTQRPWIGLVAGCAAGVGKEIYDSAHGGEPASWHAGDIAITCGSSVFGYWLTKKLIKSDKNWSNRNINSITP